MAADIGTVIDMLGHKLDDGSLRKLIREHGRRESGKFDFETFVDIAGNFVDVEEDADAIREELREAFRLYDKEGVGYLTTEVLRDILHELDDKISDEDLDMMIDEIDADGSGTVDFEGKIAWKGYRLKIKLLFVFAEFMEVMTGDLDDSASWRRLDCPPKRALYRFFAL